MIDNSTISYILDIQSEQCLCDVKLDNDLSYFCAHNLKLESIGPHCFKEAFNHLISLKQEINDLFCALDRMY